MNLRLHFMLLWNLSTNQVHQIPLYPYGEDYQSPFSLLLYVLIYLHIVERDQY